MLKNGPNVCRLPRQCYSQSYKQCYTPLLFSPGTNAVSGSRRPSHAVGSSWPV